MNRHVALFLTIAFGFAYSVWIGAYLLYKVFHLLSLTGFLLSTVIPMAGPALGVVTVKLFARTRPSRTAGARGSRASRLVSTARYSVLGSGAAAVALLLSGVGAVACLAHWYGKPVDWGPFGSFLVVWAVCLPVWIPLVFLEEVGWRYYLFNAWKEKGFLLAGPILGIIWALWHLPTFFFYGSFWFNLACYLLFVPAIHFLAAWAYVKGGSLLAPMLIHATYNAFATATGVSHFMYSGQQPYQMSVPEMVTKMSSNAVFFLGLLPFAFLLARELGRKAGGIMALRTANRHAG
ncbi:MAG: lysostaphin resistance A-like protein [Acidobacteriota bacterium]